MQSYGSGCNPVGTVVPTLTGSFDNQNCSLSLVLTGFQGCCNTFLWGNIFAFGATRTQLPAPFFGPGCTLYMAPIAVLPLARTVNTLTIKVPSNTPKGTIYAQGVADYFTTIGFRHNYALTAGLSIQVL